MSSNNLDKLFKNKLENREFEFKDSYWGKMDATLEKIRIYSIIRQARVPNLTHRFSGRNLVFFRLLQLQF